MQAHLGAGPKERLITIPSMRLATSFSPFFHFFSFLERGLFSAANETTLVLLDLEFMAMLLYYFLVHGSWYHVILV